MNAGRPLPRSDGPIAIQRAHRQTVWPAPAGRAPGRGAQRCLSANAPLTNRGVAPMALEQSNATVDLGRRRPDAVKENAADVRQRAIARTEADGFPLGRPAATAVA